jgi:hypothetical protein
MYLLFVLTRQEKRPFKHYKYVIVISVVTWPPFHLSKSPWYPLDRKLGVPQGQSECSSENNLCSSWKSNPNSWLIHPMAWSLYLLTYPALWSTIDLVGHSVAEMCISCYSIQKIIYTPNKWCIFITVLIAIHQKIRITKLRLSYFIAILKCNYFFNFVSDMYCEDSVLIWIWMSLCLP